MSKRKRLLKFCSYFEVYRLDTKFILPKEVSSDGVVLSFVKNEEVLWQTVSTFSQVLDCIFDDFLREKGRYEYSFKEILV